jgi:hypothetical protein
MTTLTSLQSILKQFINTVLNRYQEVSRLCHYCDQVSNGFELQYLPLETLNEISVYCNDNKEINDVRR